MNNRKMEASKKLFYEKPLLCKAFQTADIKNENT